MSILRKLKCLLGYHDYRVHQAFTPYSRRMVCDHCNGDWAMNDNIQVMVRWNSSFHELYQRMGYEVRPVKLINDGNGDSNV